jgi:hypothetical protein
MVRQTWRGWRRVSLNVTAARGIESFEQLTVDQLGSLDMKTVALGARIALPSLTGVAAAWEHERRSNGTTINRFTLSIAQSFP